MRVQWSIGISGIRNVFQPRRENRLHGPRLALVCGDPGPLRVFSRGLISSTEVRHTQGPHSLKEDQMFRSVLSIAVLSCLLCALPVTAAAQTKTTVRTAAKPPSTAIVNLNTAAVSDLEGLPGIGAKTAARIVEYRQKNGPFKKIEELMNVSGIGEKNFLKLKPQLTVAPAKAEHDRPEQR
jgi:comEA protein